MLTATSINAANAENRMEIEVIRERVKTFLYKQLKKQLPANHLNNVQIHVRNLDDRLKLSACDKPLTLHLQGKSIQRNSSVKVSCQSEQAWSIYVSSSIALNVPVVTLRRAVPRHHILQEKDLMTSQLDIYSIRNGYTTSKESILGKQLKRPLKAGDVIYSYHLQAPDIIKKGDQVTVIANRGGLSVVSAGIALNDASKGEKVRIENQRSTRIIQAKVIGPGTVEVL